MMVGALMISYDHWSVMDMTASAKYSCNPAKHKNLIEFNQLDQKIKTSCS
jgi:hypothetical protein